MPIGFKKRESSPRRPRRPLSIFSKTSAILLLIISGFWGLIALLTPGNLALLVNALVVAGLAGLITTGVRWAPLLGSLLCGLLLFAFVTQSSFPLYHLAHPRDAYGPASNPWLAYLFFTVIVVLFWCMILTVISGITAVVQNYRRDNHSTPRWFRLALTGLIGLLIGAVLLGAFAPTPTSAVASTAADGATVIHLGVSNFSQTQVTLSKGSKLLFIDDGTFGHNISTGQWVQGQPQQEQFPGEPVVNHVKLANAGQQLEIGPFTTAGTYHLYCSVHRGMMLTITVQ